MANNNNASNNADLLGERLLALCKKWDSAPSPVVVQSFIAQGANVNTKDNSGETVLIVSSCFGHLDAVKTLLPAEGIDIYAKNKYGSTAFLYACRGGHIEIAKALLAAHKDTSIIDINHVCVGGLTTLGHACVANNVEVVELVLSFPRINTHLKSKRGTTALDKVKVTRNGDEIRALFRGELFSSILTTDK
jgi:hypothetical protein